MDAWALLPVKDPDEKIVMCSKYPRNKSEETLKETLLADCQQMTSFQNSLNKEMSPF